MLRDLLTIWRDMHKNEEMPALVKYYFHPHPIKDSWERKVHPDWSGHDILSLMVANSLLQTTNAMESKAILTEDFPTQLWKWKFDKCVRELRDQIREDDIINKDVCMRELELFHGPREDGGLICSR